MFSGCLMSKLKRHRNGDCTTPDRAAAAMQKGPPAEGPKGTASSGSGDGKKEKAHPTASLPDNAPTNACVGHELSGVCSEKPAQCLAVAPAVCSRLRY